MDLLGRTVQLKDGTVGVVKRISDDGELHIAAEPVGWAHVQPNEVAKVIVKMHEFELWNRCAEAWALDQVTPYSPTHPPCSSCGCDTDYAHAHDCSAALVLGLPREHEPE